MNCVRKRECWEAHISLIRGDVVRFFKFRLGPVQGRVFLLLLQPPQDHTVSLHDTATEHKLLTPHSVNSKMSYKGYKYMGVDVYLHLLQPVKCLH